MPCVLLAPWESLVPLSPFMLFFLSLKALFLSRQGSGNQELIKYYGKSYGIWAWESDKTVAFHFGLWDLRMMSTVSGTQQTG